jgi:NAD(P)-dependent dehydrogenase (short-subunit alcohol dehydrogenase family)
MHSLERNKLVSAMTEQSGRLSGKVAIVTGGGQGIGRAYCVALASAGANVVVADVIDPAGTVAEITAAGGRSIGVLTDVGRQDSLQNMAESTVRHFGRIDVLVNNASIFSSLHNTPLDQIDESLWDKVMAVNVKGTWLAIRACLPAMRAAGGGKVINISSATFFKGTPLLLHYVTSKGAVIALTRAAARELGSDNITVNAIAPGLVVSSSVEGNADLNDSSGANASTRSLKRKSTPSDLVGTLLYLASAESDFTTGQTLVVDGGSIMH